LGSGISGAHGARQVLLVIKDRWCSHRLWQRGLNRSAHAGLAPMAAGPPAQMAHPKGLMTPEQSGEFGPIGRRSFGLMRRLAGNRRIRIVLELNRATQY